MVMNPKLFRISTENIKYQQADALKRNRAKRHKSKVFFVEGVKPLNQLTQSRVEILAFLYSPETNHSDWANEILRNSRAEEHWELSLGLMSQLSDKEETSEIIALAKIPNQETLEIPASENMLVLVFDRPTSPGNFGTIIRSAVAMKVNGIIMTGHGVDLYDPKTIRASLGTQFALPILQYGSHTEVGQWCDKQQNAQCIGTSVKAKKIISDQDFSKPTVLILGNEAKGLSLGYRDLCDEIVKIETPGSGSSLNVSSAAAIALYEINRQRAAR